MSQASPETPGPTTIPQVTVAIVTYNDAADLVPCLGCLDRQEGATLEIVVVDNASDDSSAQVARDWQGDHSPLRVLAQRTNLGFAAGMNVAINDSAAPYLLSLNADTRPEPDFVHRLLERMTAHPERTVGAVTGRLLRPVEAGHPRRLDACGMCLTRAWRHLDRGSGEVDQGQWTVAERVFGGTGAATLFRRQALEDVAVDGEVFDPFFHSFREDAELSFRLQERGWEVLYEPTARAEHRRFNLPRRRGSMPAMVNRHSLKNRYLLRLYHQSAGNFVATLIPTLWRDLQALGYVLLRERSSLPAYSWLWRNRSGILRKRRLIRARRTRPAAEVNRWFSTAGLPL